MTIDEQAFERLVIIWDDDITPCHIEDVGHFIQEIVKRDILPTFSTGQKLFLLAGFSIYDHSVSSAIFVLEED